MLKTGKLDSDFLKETIFDKIKYKNESVKVRPGIGEDCAVIDFGDYECVMSTDPITADVSDIGRLAIHITCNDIASNGIHPEGIMLAVMLPEGTTEEDVDHIMGQAAEAAAELEIEIIGGHTEVTPAVNQPVIVSTAIGKAVSGGSQTGNDMKAGDCILMTKSVGLEGCGIIAREHEEGLKEVLTKDELDRAKGFLDEVNVVAEGTAAGTVGTHGMHDVTEGGIMGAVWEMCQISHKGAEIWLDDIPIEPAAEKICRYFNIDPLRLISSGSMVIVTDEDKKDEMVKAVKEAGVDCSVIGRVRDESFGIMSVSQGKTSEIIPPYTDEIYKVVGK